MHVVVQLEINNSAADTDICRLSLQLMLLFGEVMQTEWRKGVSGEGVELMSFPVLSQTVVIEKRGLSAFSSGL